LTTIEGDLVIAKADTDGFQELSRAKLVEKNRQTLSIANGCGYLRDDSEVVCVELATPKIDLAFEGETIDSWHGFKRHKFSYDGQEAWVVESKSPRAVLDYQSWPGGKGKGKGSPGDWQELRKWYGFESDEQATDYPQTPLKTLGVLAKHQIAIVSVVGDSDEVVPVDENTALAEKIYKELGGVIEVIHKPGVGHHPHGLDDPTPVVEFIEKYTMQK
jgi:hypothetical protein